MSGVLERVEPIREDYLGTYYYDEGTNEIIMMFKSKINRLEASVLIECLAEFIIDVSQAQSSRGRENEKTSTE